MSLRSFLKLVEIQTNVASVIPFLLGTFYARYRFNDFKAYHFFLMLISLLCIDMATTAINNYFDYKNANRKYGYGYERHNAIVRDNLKESTVLAVIFTLFAVAVVSGFLLFLNTNVVVLILGGISFLVGIFYTFGPVPISRTPLGEIFSGLFMGLVIPFISIYIHIFDDEILSLDFSGTILHFRFDIPEILYMILLSLPSVAGIANIMLANNICDMEDDLENKRYTLPIYIGKDRALALFRLLYYIGYMALMVLLALRVLPLVSALTLLTFFIVRKNIKAFYEKQTKKDTFVLAVRNFVIMNMVLALTLLLGVII